MARTIVVLLAAVLLAGAVLAAAPDSAIVGKWDLTATDNVGQVTTWTLVVKEDGGKLSGSLVGSEVTIELIDPKLDGQTFTFKIKINENDSYVVETQIDGNKIEGKFKGPEASGTVQATRQS